MKTLMLMKSGKIVRCEACERPIIYGFIPNDKIFRPFFGDIDEIGAVIRFLEKLERIRKNFR